MGQALSQTNQPVSPSEVTNDISPDALATKLGTVYHQFRVERVDPAGVTISYVLDGGGLGMDKVPFNQLPDNWQQRYGYDPEKATNQPVSPLVMTNDISSDQLETKLGAVYHKYRVERVDPAGLTISYMLDGDGLGMEKVPFNLLPDDWQRRSGYDPKKAAEFDLEQKQATAQLREQMIADEQAYREKRAKEEADEEAVAEKAKIDAEAAATQATNAPAITDTNQPAPPLPPDGH